jgi:hypothetical protein
MLKPTQMWEKLDAYTVSRKTGSERSINARNEWGGYSRRLKLPVFTAWQDRARSSGGQTQFLVSDTNWSNTAGVNNQEYWLAHALEHGGEAAVFVIKAVDLTERPRRIESLDDTRVLCGPIERVGTQTFITGSREIRI